MPTIGEMLTRRSGRWDDVPGGAGGRELHQGDDEGPVVLSTLDLEGMPPDALTALLAAGAEKGGRPVRLKVAKSGEANGVVMSLALVEEPASSAATAHPAYQPSAASGLPASNSTMPIGSGVPTMAGAGPAPMRRSLTAAEASEIASLDRRLDALGVPRFDGSTSAPAGSDVPVGNLEQQRTAFFGRLNGGGR